MTTGDDVVVGVAVAGADAAADAVANGGLFSSVLLSTVIDDICSISDVVDEYDGGVGVRRSRSVASAAISG